MECKQTIVQEIELSPLVTLRVVLGRNGYIQVIEKTGTMCRHLKNLVEIAPVCDKQNEWVLLSKGHKPLVLNKTEYGWNLKEVEVE